MCDQDRLISSTRARLGLTLRTTVHGIRHGRFCCLPISMRVLLFLFLTLGFGPLTHAEGQASMKTRTKPILVYQTQGHSGTVTSILFDPVTGQVLTGGLDKVVNVWRPTKDRLELVRTIRPPIWRGSRGAILTMDLSPFRDAQDEAVLATGGYGLQASNGDIGLFGFPGKANLGTGDHLPRLNGQGPDGTGHLDQVEALAFHPNGRFLASGGADGTVRLWDYLQNHKEFRALPGIEPGVAVKRLVFDAKGDRLWVGSAGGRIQLWDLSQLEAPRQMADSGESIRAEIKAEVPQDRMINAMALSPDESTLFVGLENGRLAAIDALTLQNAKMLPDSQKRGPVEAIAVSKDGKLATSIISNKYVSAGQQSPPRADCIVELRDLQTGAVTSVVHQAKHRILCLRFSPDGKSLAFAGDVGQSVFLKRFSDQALLESRGQGSSLWDVGFAKTGLTIGLSRNRPEDPGPPVVQAFNLKTRETDLILKSDLVREIRTLGAWNVQAVDHLRLQVINAGVAYPIPLPETAMRWWDFTFVPVANRPENEPPLVAVGCADGQVLVFAPSAADPNNPAWIYSLTHRLSGHSSAVLSVAPSPDGKWLATGSDDQTVRLWLVKSNWKSIPALGMKSLEQNGQFTVSEVEPRGFADAMGLEKGDVLKSFRLTVAGTPGFDGKTPITVNADMIAFWDQYPPGEQLILHVQRGAQELDFITSKMDSAALSLFLAENLEWVTWTPEAYYDTSIAGDRRYLGFHTNGADALEAYQKGDDSQFFGIDQFEKELRKPKLLDDLIELANPVLAYANVQKVDAPELAEKNKPPGVRLGLVPPLVANADGPLVVDNPQLDLDVVVDTKGFSTPTLGLKEIRVLVDSGRVETRAFPLPVEPIPPNQQVPHRFKVNLKPGLQRVSAEVVNEKDVTKPESVLVNFRPKAPLPVAMRPAELHVISFGTGEFPSGKLSPIGLVEQDTNDLAAFFTDPRIHRYLSTIGGKPIIGKAATLPAFISALDSLEQERMSKSLGQGDTVVVSIQTHLLALSESQSVLAGSDFDVNQIAKTGISTKEISERLSKLADAGCHVLLVLDVNHPNVLRPDRAISPARGLKEWVRSLQPRKIMVCVAATVAPAQPELSKTNSAFARAIKGSIDRGNWKRLASPDEVMTLGDFKETVEALVDRYTESKQISRFYEANVLLGVPFLTPPPQGLPIAANPK